MINYDNLVISKYAKTLYWKNLCIIGNIAVDGRWIKIPKSVLIDSINKLESTDSSQSLDEVTRKVFDKLYEIHVLIEKNKIEDEEKNLLRPQNVTIELTTLCNLKCKHCSYSFGGNNYKEMCISTVIGLAKWCSENGVQRIILTGGEPFCRTDIFEILEGIRSFYSGSLEIMTNGTLIDKSDIPFIIENVNRLHISLDGYDEVSVSSIRGQYVFEKIITLINNLHSNNFKDISLSCVDTGDQEKITHFYELTKRLNVHPVVRKLNLKGKANENFKYKNAESIELSSLNGTNMKSICHHSYSSLFVNTNGEVFPCAALREIEYIIGKFLARENKFEFMLDSLVPIIDTIEDCSSCPVRYFCSTPCISQNDVIYLNKEYRMERCKKLYEKLITIVWDNVDVR